MKSEKYQTDFGSKLAHACHHKSCVIYLQGAMGTGKTTLARGFLHQLGYQGKVKSPTYTLLETYQISCYSILHADLYRLESPQEAYMLGLKENLIPHAGMRIKSSVQNNYVIYLIEWPEKALNELPAPDISCWLTYSAESLRACEVQAYTPAGQEILHALTLAVPAKN